METSASPRTRVDAAVRDGATPRGGLAVAKYLIVFGAHAMDHVPEAEMPAVAEAARAVCKEAIDAGVYVMAGGLEDQPASIVGIDGTVSAGVHPDALGGITIVDVPTRDDALRWAAKIAAACRCDQEVLAIGPDPAVDAMLRDAANGRR